MVTMQEVTSMMKARPAQNRPMDIQSARVRASLRAALAAGGEPLCAYVYDLAELRAHAHAMVAALPRNCELFYSVKANADLPVLETLAPIVHGFGVGSSAELSWVRQHFPYKPLAFSGPGKHERDLDNALSQQVDCLHVESLAEIERLAAVCRRRGQSQPILLRVNLPADLLAGIGQVALARPTPFGIGAGSLHACLMRLLDHPQLELRGFHFHLATHQISAHRHLQLIEACLKQVRTWIGTYRLRIDQVNGGGGVGINYCEPGQQFDWAWFCRALDQLLDGCRLKVRFELGRYVSAACGYYAMQVIDIKRSHGTTFVVGRGGSHHFRTPAAHGHSHPFHVLPVASWPYSFERPRAAREAVSVVGQLCSPGDLLAFDAPVEQVACNDVLVFPLAGAYANHGAQHGCLNASVRQWYLPAS
ncbi:MAG: type III PLP-dependent enzyme [Gammaproteobacteria bacterium]